MSGTIPECNTRIHNIDRIRKAYLMWEDVPIAELIHEYSSLSSMFSWAVKPLYENFPKCEARGEYVDICGIDLGLNKEIYYRRYDIAVVTQRLIPEGREDLKKYLQLMGLTNYDKYEALCRGHGVCGNDDYYVSRTPDKIIDVNNFRWVRDFDMPPKDFVADDYGWLDHYENPAINQY